MQTLKFEYSWDKALSHKDRKTIEAIFLETCNFNNGSIQLIPLWQASNHKGELLVTVLIHNFTQCTYNFNETLIGYSEHNELLAKHLFTISSLVIPPVTTMPWTFIFPIEKSFKNISPLQNGLLTIIR